MAVGLAAVIATAAPAASLAGPFAGCDATDITDKANVTGAALASPSLTGVTGTVIGIPASLPMGWKLVAGRFNKSK